MNYQGGLQHLKQNYIVWKIKHFILKRMYHWKNSSIWQSVESSLYNASCRRKISSFWIAVYLVQKKRYNIHKKWSYRNYYIKTSNNMQVIILVSLMEIFQKMLWNLFTRTRHVVLSSWILYSAWIYIKEAKVKL